MATPTKTRSRSALRKKRPARVRKWSTAVSKTSDALDLKPGIFKSSSARSIALSLKRSADSSGRRKASPFQSAMSMLNFEINRGGRGLSKARRDVLNRAKRELRKAYGRPKTQEANSSHHSQRVPHARKANPRSSPRGPQSGQGSLHPGGRIHPRANRQYSAR